MKNKIYLFLIVIFILFGVYFSKKIIISEGFSKTDSFIQDNGSSYTSHTVNLPINTNYSCQNMCGPLSTCSITQEQCTSDVDCYGCQPIIGSSKNTNKDIKGQNDAGKLTTSFTPTYSTLTTDIGTQAKLVKNNINITPVQYFNGINQWRDSFDAGMEIYNEKYNPGINKLPFMPNYPKRPTLSGQFIDDGPLASNAYL